MRRRWAIVALYVVGACGNGEKPRRDMSASSDMAMAEDMSASIDMAIPQDLSSSSLLASATIGSGGGTLSLADGTKIDIPAGALTSSTTITIAAESNAPADAVGPAYIFGPEGTQFATPVTVTLPYQPSNVPSGSAVAVATAPASSSSFTSLGGTAVDATHESAMTSHFSTFVVIAYASTDDGGSPVTPTTVAPMQASPTNVIADGTAVFWIDSTQKNGGSATATASVKSYAASTRTLSVLAQNDIGSSLSGLALDSTNLYFEYDHGGAANLAKCAKAGCGMSPTTLLSGVDAESIAVDSTTVYWGDHQGNVYGCAISGCANATLIATTPRQALQLTVSNGSLFWIDKQTGLYSASTTGTNQTGTLFTNTGSGYSNALVSDGQSIYFSNAGAIAKCPTAGCGTGGPTPVIQDLTNSAIVAMALDATKLYWANNTTNDIMSVPLAGGPSPTTLAINQINVQGLALGQSNLYWNLYGTYNPSDPPNGAIVVMPK